MSNSNFHSDLGIYKELIIFISVYVSELNKNPVEGFSAGLIDDNDIYRWEVLIIGPPDTL